MPRPENEKPPVREDRDYDAENFNPQIEPKNSKAWLNLLNESEEAFEDYNTHCDLIDRQYAHLARLANHARDKEFQMFWANAEVLKPSIYAKPPIPVVTVKFKDRRPVYQASAEFLERCVNVAFDLAGIDGLMKLVRDDLGLLDRGVAWCRYDEGTGKGYHGYERVCVDFKHRRDFLHSISRNWREVGWVAGASYMTRAEARKRFFATSGTAYQDAEYRVDRDTKEIGGTDARHRAKIWEIWDKSTGRVLWVAKGCDVILDEDDAHLELRNFFPCPQPAYGTTQRGSLVPVPDVLQYKDQLEELNLLTGRIHALSDALEVKGFYPAGGSELADAIQAAIAVKTPGRVLVPISNWAAFGGSKEIIIWLPIDVIATTLTALVTLRKEIINDIYQIMGLSDIMRGATDPNETLGAQQLKTQYGSTRIRDKQQELVRLARDIVEIASEIITSEFDEVTMIEMSQTDLPTQQMQQRQVMQIQQQMQNQQMAMQQMAQMPQAQQLMQQNPQQSQQLMEQGKQMLDQGQKAITKIMNKPTVEQVLTFLKNAKAKAFILDIETDSTIMPNEQLEKQQRAEFTGVLSQLLPQLAAMVGAQPKTATFCGELLRFAVAPYRAGRALDGAIDELVEQLKDQADQPPPPNPDIEKHKAVAQIEQQKLLQQKQKDDADIQLQRDKLKQEDDHARLKIEADVYVERMKMKGKEGDAQAKQIQTGQKMIQDKAQHDQKMVENAQKMRMGEQKMRINEQQQALRQSDMVQRQADRHAQQQFNMQQRAMQPPPVRRQ